MNTTVETQAMAPTRTEQSKLTRLSLKEVVCWAFGLPEDKLFIQSRRREILDARKCYMYFTSEIFGKGPTQTGRIVKQAHCTVIAALKVFNKYYRTEPYYAQSVDKVFEIYYDGMIKCPNNDTDQ